MKTMNKYNYNANDKTLTVNGIVYTVVNVVDHLEDIMKATTGALNDFTRGRATALDFSAIRPRGSKTSHAGVATGPASFAKAFADLVEVLSGVNDDVRHRPIAIVDESHQDIEEYSSLKSNAVDFLVKTPEWDLIPVVEDLGGEKPTPNWKLTSQELADVNIERSERASPFRKTA